jgi:hypothetical protein
MHAHGQVSVPPIRGLRSDVPAALVAILDKLLAKSAADRYPSAADVSAVLQPLTANHDFAALMRRANAAGVPASLATPQIPPTTSAALPPTRHGRLLAPTALAAAGLIVLAVLVAFLVWRAGRTPEDSATAQASLAKMTDEGPARLVRAVLEIKHYRPGKKPEDLIYVGRLGEGPSLPHQGDLLYLKADFDEPVYSYLVMIQADGSHEWLVPDPKAESPPQMPQRHLEFPPDDGTGTAYLPLSDTGPVGFVVLGARQPLLPFAQVATLVDVPAWRQTEFRSAWGFDGGRCEPLGQQRVGIEHVEPGAFAATCRRLKERRDVVAIRALAVSVQAKSSD